MASQSGLDLIRNRRSLDVQRHRAREQRHGGQDSIKRHPHPGTDVLLFGDGFLHHAEKYSSPLLYSPACGCRPASSVPQSDSGDRLALRLLVGLILQASRDRSKREQRLVKESSGVRNELFYLLQLVLRRLGFPFHRTQRTSGRAGHLSPTLSAANSRRRYRFRLRLSR